MRNYYLTKNDYDIWCVVVGQSRPVFEEPYGCCSKLLLFAQIPQGQIIPRGGVSAGDSRNYARVEGGGDLLSSQGSRDGKSKDFRTILRVVSLYLLNVLYYDVPPIV